jgi:ABC-2 type transport system ATP-binding protein
MTAVAVRTERLTKDFVSGFWRAAERRALENVSLSVPSGSMFGLLGPNGAGKSTTIKLLLQLLRPTSGSCEVLGRPPGDLDARRRIGFLPEHPSFYRQLTGEQFVEYVAALFGFRGEDRRRRTGASLDRAGLDADRRRPIREYSRGMLQRLGLAQAIVNDPELVILDEPMTGLDPIGRRDLCDLLLQLRRDGRTVVFSSHILSDVERLCTHAAILHRGRLQAGGTVPELTKGRPLEETFLDVVAAGERTQR